MLKYHYYQGSCRYVVWTFWQLKIFLIPYRHNTYKFRYSLNKLGETNLNLAGRSDGREAENSPQQSFGEMLDFKSRKRAFWQWGNVVFLWKGKEWLINKENQFSSKFLSWIHLPLKFTMGGLLTQTGKVLFLHLLFTWWWLKQNGLTAQLKNNNLSNSIWENKQLQNGNYQV